MLKETYTREDVAWLLVENYAYKRAGFHHQNMKNHKGEAAKFDNFYQRSKAQGWNKVAKAFAVARDSHKRAGQAHSKAHRHWDAVGKAKRRSKDKREASTKARFSSVSAEDAALRAMNIGRRVSDAAHSFYTKITPQQK